MKYSIIKPCSILLGLFLIFTACDTEESIEFTTPEAAFMLQQPSISNIFLNFGIANNAAFTISWNDEVTGSSTYDIQMALTESFDAPVNIGTSSTDSFSITVNELNTAINNAGPSTTSDIAVYVRVNAGSVSSNGILFLVTTYPSEAAVFTSPANGDSFILSLGSLDETILNVEWTDSAENFGDSVEYTIEAALAGTDFESPVSVGTGSDIASITATHSELNAVALGLGLIADTAGDVDMRIIGRTTNTSGNVLERISETVTVSITPFSVSFPFLYFVGDATTPGWNNNNNNTPVFRNQDVPNNYTYTGYFNAGAFKLLQTLGQWQPQWGTNDGATLAVNPGDTSDPGVFSVSAAGYYTYSFTTVGNAGSFTVEAFDESASPTYPTIGIIGDATPDGWNADTDLTQDPNNPHLWFINGVTLTNGGQMLIRANNDWVDVWRYTGSEEDFYGVSVLAGGGDNIPFNGDTGTYDVWFNDLDGSYVFIQN